MKPSKSNPTKLLTFSIVVGLLLLAITVLDILKHAPTLGHTSGHLSKRAKDTPYGKDKLSFNQAVGKGNQWVCNLPNDPPADRQTKFATYDQLKTNGWTDSGDHPDPNTLDELKELTVSCVHVPCSLQLEMPSDGELLWLGSSQITRIGG